VRRMSFFLTKRQFLDGSKDVTRRLGQWGIQPEEHFLGIEKGQGLKKGEKQVVLGECVCVSARGERLDAITTDDVRREGFPEMTPTEFVEFFCKANRAKGCEPSTIVNRIEFKKVSAS